MKCAKHCSPPSLHIVGLDFPHQALEKDTPLNYVGASLTLCTVFSARRRISQPSMDDPFGNAHDTEAQVLFSSDLNLNSGRLECRKPYRPGTLTLVFGVLSGDLPLCWANAPAQRAQGPTGIPLSIPASRPADSSFPAGPQAPPAPCMGLGLTTYHMCRPFSKPGATPPRPTPQRQSVNTILCGFISDCLWALCIWGHTKS